MDSNMWCVAAGYRMITSHRPVCQCSTLTGTLASCQSVAFRSPNSKRSHTHRTDNRCYSAASAALLLLLLPPPTLLPVLHRAWCCVVFAVWCPTIQTTIYTIIRRCNSHAGITGVAAAMVAPVAAMAVAEVVVEVTGAPGPRKVAQLVVGVAGGVVAVAAMAAAVVAEAASGEAPHMVAAGPPATVLLQREQRGAQEGGDS